MGLFDKFKRHKGEELSSGYGASVYEYDGVAVEEDEESLRHVDEYFACLQKEGIEKIIRERFIPWFKGEQFEDRDDQKIFEGLRVFSITYHYLRIIAKYSPTKEDGFLGSSSSILKAQTIIPPICSRRPLLKFM